MITPFDTALYLEAANSPAFILPENERRPRPKPRASGLHDCARKQAYYMANVPATNFPALDAVVTQELGRLSESYSKAVISQIKSPLVGEGWDGLTIRDGAGSLPDDYFVTGHNDGEVHRRRRVETPGGGNHNEYDDRLSDGLRWGWEHKLYGAYSYKEVIFAPDIITGASGLVSQGLLYGDALGWDAVVTTVLSSDASLIRGEVTKIRNWAETGKSADTRERNSRLLERYLTKNPKVDIDYLDLRTMKAAFIPKMKRRAVALTETHAAGISPDLVAREKDPAKHPLCGYCDWKDRCVAAGQSSVIVIPESPIKEK